MIDSLLLLCRVVLVAVFGTSAFAKLWSRAESAQAMLDFGVLARFAAPLGTLLPYAELACSLALLSSVTARAGAFGSLVLLALFVAATAWNLARGRHPECHCFGRLGSSPIGRDLLMRDVALAALAVPIVVLGPGASEMSPLEWLVDLSPFEVALLLGTVLLLCLSAALLWLVLQLVAQNGRILLRLEALERSSSATVPQPPAAEIAAPAPGLAVGSPAPDFLLKDINGAPVSLHSLLAPARPLVLAFVDPDCSPCRSLMPELVAWQHQRSDLEVAIISRGSIDKNRALAAKFGKPSILIQPDDAVARRYDALATPSAVLVRPDGRVSGPVARGQSQIRGLVSPPRQHAEQHLSGKGVDLVRPTV